MKQHNCEFRCTQCETSQSGFRFDMHLINEMIGDYDDNNFKLFYLRRVNIYRLKHKFSITYV